MTGRLISSILAAAITTACLPGTTLAAEKQDQPAAQPGSVPVKAVVLFSSGVAYFEHFGKVQGSGSTELRFKTQQINDILKSLVLQELDGGKVTPLSYPSQAP